MKDNFKSGGFGNKGMTVLEMLIAGTIFVVFITGFIRIWATTDRQRMYLVSRAKMDREIRTARNMILKDMGQATLVESTAPATIAIYMDDSNVVTYFKTADGKLARHSYFGEYTITAGMYLSDISGVEDSSGNFKGSMRFSKKPFFGAASNISMDLNVFWNNVLPS